MRTTPPASIAHWAFSFILLLTICFRPLSLDGQLCSYATSYGSGITVDGNLNDWNLTEDFYADMYEAGCPPGVCINDKDLLSKLYLRYDCASETMYVLVVMEPGQTADLSADDAWVKIDANNNKVFDGDSGNDGTPPDFEWSADTDVFEGYEASFPLPKALDPNVANYTLEAHISTAGRTSSTGKFAQTNEICLDISCPDCTDPDPPDANGSTYCEVAIINAVTATGDPGASFTWYEDMGLSMMIMSGVSGTNNEIFTAVMGGSYYVTQTVNGCESDATEVVISIVPASNSGAPSNVMVCNNSGTTINLIDLLDGEDSGGSWTRESGMNGTFDALAGTFEIAVDATNSSFRYIVAGTTPCPAVQSDVTVFIKDCTTCVVPDPPAASGASYCLGDIINSVTALGDPGATFTWYSNFGLTDVIVINVSGANNEIFTPGGEGTFYVTQTIGGCESLGTEVTILVNTPANPGTPSNSTICNNSMQVIDLYGLLDGEDSGGIWTRESGANGTFSAGDGTFAPAPDATNSVFRYTVSGTPPCVDVFTEVTITIDDCTFESIVNTFGLNDPCKCDGNQSYNGSGDGTFTETVTVIGMGGFGVFAGPGTTPASLIGAEFIEISSGVYQLILQHQDARGFDVHIIDHMGNPIIDRSFTPMSFSNVCAYPEINEPTFDPMCNQDPPLDIIAMVGGTGGTVTADLKEPGGNIIPVTTFDPGAAAPGEYLVTWYFYEDFVSNTNGTVVAPAIPGCTTSYSALFELINCLPPPFPPPPAPPAEIVPTLSEWAIVVLALGLLILGVVAVPEFLNKEKTKAA